jgi:hypothetical protein
MKTMENYAIAATDGLIGLVKDFYFDDAAWVVRYLVVETGDWLAHRKVLISPISFGEPNWANKTFPVSISQAQVKTSPNIDTDKPVSRQHEEGYLRFFDYPYYWGGTSLWGGGLYAGSLVFDSPNYGSAAYDAHALVMLHEEKASAQRHSHDDPHLRSGNTVMHYSVHATDGDIGRVKGLLVDDMTWAIRYLVVSTSSWWGGHDVLIAPEWIDDINWSESTVVVDLSRQAVKDSPPYDSEKVLTRDLERSTCKHYGRDGYLPREAEHVSSRPSASVNVSS